MKNNNYYLPAEWEEHDGTWIGFPHNKTDWPGKFEPIPWVYGEIVRKLSRFEKVNVFVQDDKHKLKAIKVFEKANAVLKNIIFHTIPTDRGWTRDTLPAFVKSKSGDVKMIDFKFNAWAKYDNYHLDKKLSPYISKKLKMPLTKAMYNNKHVVLEGGGIDSNGCGTLLTTEECFLDSKVQVRNKNFTSKDYEKVFKEYLGIKNVLWLGNGIKGDDTHGHVDDLCRFVNKNTIVIVSEDNPADENYKNLAENYERTQDFKLENGSRPEVVKLPMPSPLIFEGERLPASYANFYIANNQVIVPVFNDPKDRIALGIIAELFPDREVTGINCVDLVWGFGTLHCLTHEQVK